jgi:hypothetical protein
MKRLLDYDPFSGLITWHEYDESTDTTLLHYEQDAEPVLDACKRDNNHADRKMGDGVHVASVPASIQLKWLVEKGIDMLNPDHKQAVAKLLDGEYKHLKRLPIQIGGY